MSLGTPALERMMGQASVAQFRVNGPMVIHQTVEDEVIIIYLETGAYFSLDESGAVIWGLLAAQTPVTGIVAELVQTYAGERADLEEDVTRFISQLQIEGLIVAAGNQNAMQAHSSPNGRTAAAPIPRIPFETPRLHKYTDMQEFILLDPIYEMEEMGWPDLEAVTDAKRH